MVIVRRVALSALIAASPLILYGCGGGDDPTPSPSPSPAPHPAPSPPAPSPITTAPTTTIPTTTTSTPLVPCAKYGERPASPEFATALNGIAYPPGCYTEKEDTHHVFVIGDWGGMCGYGIKNDCRMSANESAASWDHVPHPFRPFPMPNNRGAVPGIDYAAQMIVRDRMNQLAEIVDPEFVLNVGDNFYPGGIIEHCNAEKSKIDFNKMPHQFETTYEQVYNGKGLQNKEWLSVLGNHDYGGVCYNMGWPQQIWYTWNTAGSQRWIMPAQYYSRQARFDTKDGTVVMDMWFLDTNVKDTATDENHDICSKPGNMHLSDAGNKNNGWHCSGFLGQWKQHDKNGVCDGTNLTSQDHCNGVFKELWQEQIPWLEKGLRESQADWQVIVTHYPAHYPLLEKTLRPLAKKYGIDLIITGHTHSQELWYKKPVYTQDWGDTCLMISGGGGGIYSEGAPKIDGNDMAYGFMDLAISKKEIVVSSYSHQTKGDIISVTATGDMQHCSGEFKQLQWTHEQNKQFSNGVNGKGCLMYWCSTNDGCSKEDEGWVLNKDQQTSARQCKGGMAYDIGNIAGAWKCSGATGTVTLTVQKGAPHMRHKIHVTPVLAQSLESVQV